MKTKHLFQFATPILLIATAAAAPVTSVASGTWFTGTTWSDGNPAGSGNTYTVDGHTVTSPSTSNAVTFPGDAITLSKTGATAGVLDLARLHAATTQNVTLTLPAITINDGATLQFRAQTGSNVWNVQPGCDITTSGSVLINNTGGSYAQDINFSGTLTGSGLINYLTANSGSTTTHRTLTLNSADSAYSGAWFVQGQNTGNDYGALAAGAANALGSGAVTLDTRARLHCDAASGLDSLSGITLGQATSLLDLKDYDWINPAATFTGTAGFADIGTAVASVNTFTIGFAQVIMNVGGSTAGQIVTAGDADFGTLPGSLLVNIDANPEGESFDLVTYGGTLVNPPQLSMPPTGRLTPVIDNGTGTSDTVTLSFTGSAADLVWKGNDGVSPNAWDTTTQNFDNGGSPDAFVKWDDVLFDGTASSFTPEITGNLEAGTVTFDGATDYTLSGTGSISGGSSLVKNGSSTTTILNSNSITGTATVLGGTLQIGNGGTSGDLGGVTVDVQSPGTLAYFRSENGLSSATAFSGDGTVAFLGTGNINESAYNLNGDNSGFTGTITADDVRLNVNAQSDVGSALIQIADGGTLYLQAGGTLSNNVAIAGTGWMETAGQLGAIRFSAGTDVTGTITLTDDAQIGSHNQSFTFTGTLAESGSAHTLDIRNTNGGADPIFTFSGSSTRTGATTVSGNRLVVTSNDALGSGPVTVQSNGNTGSITRLQLEGVTIENDVTLASNAQTDFRGALHSAGGALSTVNGTVTVTSAVGNGGHLAAEGSTTSVLRLMGELNVGGGQSNITQRIGTVEYGGGASTTYTLSVTDIARLVADGGIGPQVRVNLGVSAAATLDLNGFETTLESVGKATSNAATVTNEGGADSTLTLSSATDQTFAGNIIDGTTNSVSIVKDGSSTLLLTGTNTYSGTTTVAGGVLGGTGSIDSDTVVQSGATLAPGASIGTLATANVTFESGSTFAAEIDSAVPSSDLLNVFGDVSIGSGVTLDISDIAGSPAALTAGTILELIDYSGGTLTGTFDGLPDGGEFTVGPNTFAIDYDDNDFVTLTVVAGTDPYAAWASANSIPGEPFDDDFDSDGIANGLEWILGGNPDAQDAASLVTVTGDSTNGLTLVFSRNPDSITATTLTVEWDDDLDAFANSLPIGTTDVGPSGDNPTIDIDAPVAGKVTVNIPAANAPGGRLFARIRAVMP